MPKKSEPDEATDCLILALVKPFRAARVLERVSQLPFNSLTVREAKGYGRQKDRLPRYRGSEFSTVYLPKIKISVSAPESESGEIMSSIVAAARTGRIGDGKIIMLKCLASFDLEAEPEPIPQPAAVTP